MTLRRFALALCLCALAATHTIKEEQRAPLAKVLRALSSGVLGVNGTFCPDNSVLHHYSCDESGDVHVLDLSQRNRDYIGYMPTEIGLLPKLTFVDLRYNLLTGTLPTELGLCTDLNTLLLYSNFFRGTIPPQLATLSKIAVCSLMLINSPTNCFDCPVPANLDCGSNVVCNSACAPAPPFGSPVETAPPLPENTTLSITVPATEATTTIAKAETTALPQPTVILSTERETPTDEQAPPSTTTTTTMTAHSAPIESRTFLHAHGNATSHAVNASVNAIDARSGSQASGERADHLTAVIILACMLILVLPLLAFFAYAYVRKRQESGLPLFATSESTLVMPSSEANSLQDTGNYMPMPGEPNDIYSNVVMPDDTYAVGGALIKKNAIDQHIYDRVDMPLNNETVRVPVNYDQSVALPPPPQTARTFYSKASARVDDKTD